MRGATHRARCAWRSRSRRSALALAAGGCGDRAPASARRGRRSPKPRRSPTSASTGSGPRFAGQPLAAADGQASYISGVGDSVYYGDCVQGKGIFGGGSCLLPLQVTTVIYRLHSNATLGPQRNIAHPRRARRRLRRRALDRALQRPVAIDIFSDTFAHALQRGAGAAPAQRARLGRGNLPAPVYCPGLSGPLDAQREPRDGEPAWPRLPARGRRRSARKARLLGTS